MSEEYNLEKIQEKTEEFIETARGLLRRDKVYFPILYSFSPDGITTVGLDDGNEEDRKEISEVMALIADTSDAMVLILNMNLIEIEDPKKEEAPEPGTIKNDPRSVPDRY